MQPESPGVSEDFDKALAIVLRHEGGKVDHPDDPGGRTAYGITQRTYDAWRAKRLQEDRDVFDIEASEVEAIYRDWYWRASGADVLWWPMCLFVFDTAVLCGVSRARSFLAFRDPAVSDAEAYLQKRRDFHRQVAARRPASAKFLKGWLNRVDSLARVAGLPVAA